MLRLSSWTPNFNPDSIRQTYAQCWVRFHGLPREYWCPKILFEIGGGIGIPIALDEATMKRSFGHFARILIEIDLNSNLRDKILVEHEGYAFFVEVEYERLPFFCTACQAIGHDISNCKRKQHSYDNSVKETEVKKDSRKVNLQYVPKVSNAEDKMLNKGKEIVQDDVIQTSPKKSLMDMAGTSNVIIETIIDPKAFLGVNNVPADAPEAQKSVSPLLGFITDNPVDFETSICHAGSSPIKGVIKMQGEVDGLGKDFQSPNQRIEVCSDDTIVADSQSTSNGIHGSDKMDKNHSVLVTRSGSTVSPISNIKNQVVAADMRIVSHLWSQDDDNLEDDIPTIPVADPSKYLMDVPVTIQEDPNAGLTSVQSKSMKKNNRQKLLRQFRQRGMFPV